MTTAGQAAVQRSAQGHDIAELPNAVSERAIENREQAKQFYGPKTESAGRSPEVLSRKNAAAFVPPRFI